MTAPLENSLLSVSDRLHRSVSQEHTTIPRSDVHPFSNETVTEHPRVIFPVSGPKYVNKKLIYRALVAVLSRFLS